MRQIISIPLLAIASQSAYAHELDGQHSLAGQLIHQLTSMHHLPVTLLLVVIGVILVRRWRATRTID